MRGKRRLNAHLKTAQVEKLKEEVLAAIERISNQQLQQKASFSAAAAKGDDVDNANDNIIKHTELRFATRETLYFKKLKKTLAMIDTEDYGMCEECGEGISFERLRARPTSTMCISCKEESERDELQSFHGRKSKSLGTSISLPAR